MHATMTKEMATLDDRIANCFAHAKTVSAKAVADVLHEAKASLAETKQAAAQAKEHALSPKLSAKEVSEAKRAMDSAAFAAERLEQAIPKLETRLRLMQDKDAEIRRRENYREVKAETEKLAEQVAREYPVLVDKLVDLLERISENEYRVRCVNAELPGILTVAMGGKFDPNAFPPLQNADEIARGIADLEQAHHKKSGMTLAPLPRLTDSVRLPKTNAGYGYAFAWPPGSNLGPVPADYATFLQTGRR